MYICTDRIPFRGLGRDESNTTQPLRVVSKSGTRKSEGRIPHIIPVSVKHAPFE